MTKPEKARAAKSGASSIVAFPGVSPAKTTWVPLRRFGTVGLTMQMGMVECRRVLQ